MAKKSKDIFDSIVDKISSYNHLVMVFLLTFISACISVPLVYLFVFLFDAEYNSLYFYLSIILPFLMTPLMIYFILKLVTNLKCVKEHLQCEIDKNKKKDIVLFEQARFALMGEMMANISHQWKQPLNTISLSVVAVRTSTHSKAELEKYFNIMEDSVNYLASTVNDFLSFFDERVSLELRDANELIKEIKSIIYSHIENKNISLEIGIDEDAKSTMMVSSITQVVLNLLNNAINALEHMEKDDRKIELYFHTKDEGISIECKDNGTGIDDSIKHKIFDPYFTTKHKTKGTGIGLFMSREIVQKVFDGDIVFKSSSAEGTHFYIFVPYSDHCIKREEE